MSFSNIAQKLILNGKDSHGAYPDNSPMGDGYLYLKYAWEIQILNDGLDSSPSLIAKSCELPRWTTETQIVNVYNHKTIVQTKLNFEPITISFYDQVSGGAEKMIWEHVSGQFDPTDGSKKAGVKPLTIKITMKALSGDGTADKVYTLKNAFITDAQHDSLDYSTSDVVVWTITVRYEDLEAPGFKGPTPVTVAGIAPLPRKEEKKKIKKQLPQEIPITAPPKADAEIERNKWVERGGGEARPASNDDPEFWKYAATGNPYISAQANRARANQEALRNEAAVKEAYERDKKIEEQERKRKERELAVAQWPETEFNRAGGKTTGGGAAVGFFNTGKRMSPSTGANQSATETPLIDYRPNRPLERNNAEFLASEKTRVENDKSLNPEYKDAYLKGLEKNPPRAANVESQEFSKRVAATSAATEHRQYNVQTRVPVNGLELSNTTSQPTPANVPANNTQASRESRVARRVQDAGGGI